MIYFPNQNIFKTIFFKHNFSKGKEIIFKRFRKEVGYIWKEIKSIGSEKKRVESQNHPSYK